jgi:hypothetical protein
MQLCRVVLKPGNAVDRMAALTQLELILMIPFALTTRQMMYFFGQRRKS